MFRERFSKLRNRLYHTLYCTVSLCLSFSLFARRGHFTGFRNLCTAKSDARVRGCNEFPADEYFPQLGECVREAATVFPSIDNTYVNLTDAQLAQLFLNITVCVLAKTRCSYMNPVTGELQEDDIVNKLQLPSLNAILVNTDFDITILQMPFRHSSVDVCAKYRNVEQATWPGVAC